MSANANPRPDVNAPPCFLHGHEWTLYSDGSKNCDRCGRYHGPDVSLVNAMLRQAAGINAYRKVLMQLPKAPTPAIPEEKPLEKPLPPAVLVPGQSPEWTFVSLLAFGFFLLGAAIAALAAGLHYAVSP